MRRSGKFFCLTILLSVLLTTAFFPAGQSVQAASAPPEQGSALLEGDGTVLEISVPWNQLKIETVAVDGREYAHVSLPGWSETAQPGAPALPVRSEVVGAPFGSSVSVQVTAGAAHTQVLPAPLLPAVTQQVDWSSPDIAEGDPALPEPVYLYLEDPILYGGSGFYPAELGQITSDGVLRQQRILGIAAYPVQYNPQTLELTVYESLRLEITFENGMAAQALAGQPESDPYDSLLTQSLLNGESARGWRQALPAEPSLEIQGGSDAGTTAWNPPSESWRINVQADGFYKLTYAEIAAAGAPSSAMTPGTLKLYNLGSEVAIQMDAGGDGEFNDDDDAIFFYGQAVDSKYTRNNVYWLTYGGSDGLRMGSRDGTTLIADGPLTHYAALKHMEENKVYVSSIPGDDNLERFMWNYIRATNSNPANWTQNFNLAAPYAAAATLRLNMVGFIQITATNPDHHVTVSLNGTQIGEVWWDGIEWQTLEMPVDPSLLLTGSNTLVVTCPNDTGVTYDVVYLDHFELEYDNTFQAENEALAFGYAESGTWKYQVNGFTTYDADTNPFAAFDITNPADPEQITGAAMVVSGPGHAAQFQDAVEDRVQYWAGLESAYLPVQGVQKDTPSNLQSSSNGADHIVITHKTFWDQAVALSAHRANPVGGRLRSMTVDVQDIYDEFSYGIVSPAAIHDFLAYTYSPNNWAAPAPTYVVLVGDGTYDPKNHLASSWVTYIPPYLLPVDGTLGETAADNRYVTLTSGDIFPDMMIGRLAVNSTGEAAALISKITAYDSMTGLDWQLGMLAVADNADSAGNFPVLSDNLIAGFIPEPYTAKKVYYQVTHATTALARTAIQTAINSGKLIVNYVGHGSTSQWASEGLLKASDVASLTNGSMTPVMLPMTCMDGYFILPTNTQALAEVITRAAGKGAVASWSPTGYGTSSGHDYLDRGFFEAVYSDIDGISFIGQATDAGKLNLWSTGGDMDLIDTYLLFGDPANMIHLQYPTVVELNSFTADASKKDVTLNWETASELDNLGFNIYRAASAEGEKTRVNAEIIPSQTPPGSTFGASYEYTDPDALKNTSLLYYWLEDVDLYGKSTFHGPVEVQSEEIKFILLSFSAIGAKNSVLLDWGTANEDMVAGYNILRATTKNGKRMQINVEQILPLGDGGNYGYTDSGRGLKPAVLRPNKTYYYWLEVVGTNDTVEEYGPVQAKVLKEIKPTPTPKPKPTAQPKPTARPWGNLWNWGR